MKNYILLLISLILFTACNRKAPRYVIGVSQCSEDEWRHKMNNEILREALFYDNVEVEIRSAKDNNQNQIADIRYFIEKEVDLLVVAPNEAIPITPIVEEAYSKGIPVIVIDRKILSDKYTAFIGADNYEIGRTVGNYVADRLKGKGKIIELTGLVGSTPAVDRHQGFVNAISYFPEIELLESMDAEWLQSLATEKMDTALLKYPHIDLVFAQNDRMAIGAYLSAWRKEQDKEIAFIGIDALPGKEYGVDQVLNKVLDATFIYPTGGDIVIQTAMEILEGLPFQRENILSTALVDETNARVMKLQTDHIADQVNKIEFLNIKMSESLTKYANQQMVLYTTILFVLIFAVLSLIILRAYRSKNRLNMELSKRNEEITLQKEQLESQRDQLIQLSKQLEEATHAKLVFFTNISHDFRTPLTLIADPVEYLLKKGSFPNEEKRLLKIIQKNAHVLLRLINQVLDFRKYENGKLELNLTEDNLKNHIEEWNNAFYSMAFKKHIKFSFEATEEVGNYLAQVDMEKMERIYFNLLSNAFKFTPENGKITTRLTSFHKDGNRYIRLVITDTGIGISPEHIRNIFDRFYKIDIHYAGTGIGLALVKAFIELHQGAIEVESNVNDGTVFTIELPATQNGYIVNENIYPIASAIIPSEKKKPSPAMIEEVYENKEATIIDPQKKSILIIDDNPDICEYVSVLLEKDYTVIQAENGRVGLKKAMKYVPDLIICDIMMPEMDGIECCKLLKSELQTCHIPVILLTACSLDEQRIEGFENGADSFISKPFNSKVLEVRIHNLLESRKRMKEFFGDNVSLEKESISDMDKDFVGKFKKLIDENLSNSELNVEELGKNMGMSRVQLYRKIKSLTNYSPNELLRIARLKKAASLLASSEMSVSEVTYEVGFSSPSYFTKCYKEYFGEIPTEFLRRKG